MTAPPGSPPNSGLGQEAEFAHALKPGVRFDEYVLTGVLGEGGFGIVYAAKDTRLRRDAAIKEYMPASLTRRTPEGTVVARSSRHEETFSTGLARFVEEAQQIAAFEHDAIVRVYRIWEMNGTAYMAMKFYDGPTLRQALRRRASPVDQAWLLKVLEPLMDALETLHAGHCLHRDVAPDNIIMTAEDKPVLLDFGAARQVIGDMTQALTAVLKPGFAPIEQYGEIRSMKQGPWTDVYALAAVVHYAITGKTPPQAVERMVNDPLIPLTTRRPAGFDADFLAAIDRALAFRPESRTPSITRLREELGGSRRPGSASDGASTAHPAPRTRAPVDDFPTLRFDRPDQPAVSRSPDGSGERPHDPDATIALPGSVWAERRDAPPTAASPTVAPTVPRPSPPASPPTAPPAATTSSPLPKALAVGVLISALAGGGFAWWTSRPTADNDRPPTNEPTPRMSSETVGPGPLAGRDAARPVASSPAGSPPAPTAVVRLTHPADLMDLIVRGADPTVRVAFTAEPTVARIGTDRLKMTVHSTEGGYLYLFVLDSDGQALMQIFPNARDPDNVIGAGQTIALPRRSWPMRAQGPEGVNRLLAVVSRSAREYDTHGLVPVEGSPASRFDLRRAREALERQPDAKVGFARCDPLAQAGCDAYGVALAQIVEQQP